MLPHPHVPKPPWYPTFPVWALGATDRVGSTPAASRLLLVGAKAAQQLWVLAATSRVCSHRHSQPSAAQQPRQRFARIHH